jgi:hypothetical protein
MKQSATQLPELHTLLLLQGVPSAAGGYEQWPNPSQLLATVWQGSGATQLM